MPEQAARPRDGVRGRLLTAGGLTGAALVLGAVLGVGAAGPAAAAAAEPPAGAVRCEITDPALAELSGLVVVGDQMLAINDGGDQVAVRVLDAGCQVLDVHTAAIDPFDPEDLAVGSDGSLWLADTGDNSGNRATIALIVLRPDGSTQLFRLSYPDGPHDAEALLLAPDGTPYVVTKEVLGSSGVYRPVAELVDGGTVALGKVSTVNITLTGTPGGPVGRAGQLLITGGAVARNGTALALRTYTDAYVWPLTGSDVVGALTGTPVRVPLPESPQGEAISFDADASTLVVASEGLPSAVTAVPVAAATTASAESAGGGAPPHSLTDFTSSGLSPITSAAVAAVVATIVVWVAGKVRRQP